jgi:MFS superfamily sulfate permease-like transporter
MLYSVFQIGLSAPCWFHNAGSLKLAGLVQYVPLPVVGGYLSYVGYFCFVSGVSLASGEL